MRVLIAVDMEGISGVVHWDHVDPSHSEYARFREIMTDEVNAAIDGALDGGATGVVVTDGHSEGRNILIEKLRAPARLNSGSPAPLSMVEGVQQAECVFFIGYHARANTPDAVLCHTWNDQVRGVWLNDQPVGEIGLNAAVCGSFGARVVLITGDRAAVQEAIDLLGPIESVVVKTAHGRMSAECLAIEETRMAIRHAAAHAMVRQIPPFVVSPPIRLRVTLTRPDQIDRALRLPGSQRLDGVTLEWTGGDMVSTYYAFRTIVGLGGS
ncbi:MAG TPA: M55 family metallopeptidase [Anaerolineae bacterium]|nr:M55 family metallopeptidase [Anaerolineae bacterium]